MSTLIIQLRGFAFNTEPSCGAHAIFGQDPNLTLYLVALEHLCFKHHHTIVFVKPTALQSSHLKPQLQQWENWDHPDRGGYPYTCSFQNTFIRGPDVMTVLVSQWARRKEPDREGNPIQDSWQQSMHPCHVDLALNEKWGWSLLFWCKAVMSDGHDLLFAEAWLLTRKWQLH